MKLAVTVALAAAAAIAVGSNCKPSPRPVVLVPDASDAAAAGDATPVSVACVSGCKALVQASCPMGTPPDYADCAAFLARMVGAGDASAIANAATGAPLTCADVAKVVTHADALALGFACQ